MGSCGVRAEHRDREEQGSHAHAGAPSSSEPDAALAQAAAHDRDAFLPLYERYVERIYRYCHARLRERARAEDATSEVFLRALERIDSYRGGSFVAWLFAIARNAVTDDHRRSRPEAREPSPHVRDRDATPEDWVVISAQWQAVREALGGLSDDQRAVVELQVAGWSGSQIADALGKSEAAVKMLRLRAVRKLRELMLEAGWDEGEYFDD